MWDAQGEATVSSIAKSKGSSRFAGDVLTLEHGNACFFDPHHVQQQLPSTTNYQSRTGIVAGVRGCEEGLVQMRGTMIEGLACVLTCLEAVLYGAECRPIKIPSSPSCSTETQPATLISAVQISRGAFMHRCRQVHVVTGRSPPIDVDVACQYCRKCACKVGGSFSADMQVPAPKAPRACGMRNWTADLADTKKRTTQGSF